METKTPGTLVYYRKYYEDTVVPRSTLFGLIRWEEVAHVKHLENEVVVYTDLPVKVLALNPTHHDKHN